MTYVYSSKIYLPVRQISILPVHHNEFTLRHEMNIS